MFRLFTNIDHADCFLSGQRISMPIKALVLEPCENDFDSAKPFLRLRGFGPSVDWKIFTYTLPDDAHDCNTSSACGATIVEFGAACRFTLYPANRSYPLDITDCKTLKSVWPVLRQKVEKYWPGSSMPVIEYKIF